MAHAGVKQPIAIARPWAFSVPSVHLPPHLQPPLTLAPTLVPRDRREHEAARPLVPRRLRRRAQVPDAPPVVGGGLQREAPLVVAWMVKRSEIGESGGAWLQGHGLSVGSEVLGLSSHAG